MVWWEYAGIMLLKWRCDTGGEDAVESGYRLQRDILSGILLTEAAFLIINSTHHGNEFEFL